MKSAGPIEISTLLSTELYYGWAAGRQGRPIDLKEHDPDTFAGYVQWLYSHNADTTFDTIKWARMYVLDEKFMDAEFQDTVLQTLMTGCNASKMFPTKGQISIIYNGTVEDSLARELLVDLYCRFSSIDWIEARDFANTMPADYVNDLLLELMCSRKNLGGNRPWSVQPSAYFMGSKRKTGQEDKTHAG
ncbi:hypothetical protein HBI56_188840 [Parastagonospora nodorum]|nr:hypothetical protein HBH52_160650 [Parastagonospora nodorum]KAH4031283.1 hypothetical protein HBI09_122780 [Parastagonospora nodorum]KAH4101703.1 hypothetical protein HBH46_132920 [Parastagonospora nodorum]KAH4193302.1 hypothetical protein HBH42_098880 [Parastagonospora nodorum]KAH4899652.1 hypothetical protein HBI80_162390 [Parastagonospora nodorum]